MSMQSWVILMWISTLLNACIVSYSIGGSHAYEMFDADRACRPGMVEHIIDDNRAVCIGGHNEEWTVENPHE